MFKGRIFALIFAVGFFLSGPWASAVSADDSGVVCDICGTNTPADHSCGEGLECIENQCQDASKITYCPFSSKKEITELIDKVSGWMLVIALVLAPLMIAYGAFYMLTAAGDTKRSSKGKQIVIWASIGLAVFLFSKAIVSILRHLIGF